MKKIALITAVCALAATPALADYGQVTQIRLETRAWAWQAGSGGEFRGTIIGVPITIGAYTVNTGDQWLSFCGEEAETVSGSTTNYWAVVNSASVKGDGGAYSGGNPLYNPALDPSNTGTDSKGQSILGDPLDPRTAYLFTEFSKGTLAGYDYANTNTAIAGRKGAAYALQEAIWTLEEDITGFSGGVGTSAQINAQKALYNQFLAAANASGWRTIGDVRMLDLYTGYNATSGKVTGFAQDVLIHVPVPGAVLLGFLGLSAAGLRLRRFV